MKVNFNNNFYSNSIKKNSINNFKQNFNGTIKNNDSDVFIRSRVTSRVTPESKSELSSQDKNVNQNSDITRDGFTGLRDKRCLLNRLDQKIQEAAKNGENITVAMFDMDNFKSVNELLGYEIGDEFIHKIGSSVQDVARKNSMGSYRFGGEEFVVVFSNKSKEEVEKVCSEVQKRIEMNEFMTKYSQRYVDKAKNVLNYCQDANTYLNEIKSLKEQRVVLNSMISQDSDLMKNKVFADTVQHIEQNLTRYCASMLNYALKTEENPSIIEKLQTAIDKIFSGNPADEDSVLYDDFLNNYLNVRFDKTAQIAQTKLWLSDHLKHGGFTITCGVVDVPAELVGECSAASLVDEAGEILKEGKHIQKGDIYFDTKKSV